MDDEKQKITLVGDEGEFYIINDLDIVLLNHMRRALEAQNAGDPDSGDAVEVAEYYFINHAPY